MQTIMLVRHGHVEGIDQPRFRGRQHLPLTAARMQQIEQTTAIGHAQGLVRQPGEGLIDIDFGEWQGRTHDDVLAQDGESARAWFAEPTNAPIPGNESLDALSDRAIVALDWIVGRHRGGPIAIVGPDTVNGTLLLHALGLEHYRRLRQDRACASASCCLAKRWRWPV